MNNNSMLSLVVQFITDQPQPAYCADPSLFAYMWFIPTPTGSSK